MHQNAHEPPAPILHQIPRRFVALGLVLVAVILLAALVVLRDHNGGGASPATETFTPAPAPLLDSLGHVPTAIIDSVGVTSPGRPITPLTHTGNPSLWQTTTHGVSAVPVVFFYGAEFTPYAAAERWPLTMALMRFGAFGQLGLSQSNSSVVFSSISGFTFWHSTYTSAWLDLQTVERYSTLNPTGTRFSSLQRPTARQAASIAAYDTSASTFPLLDIADRYVLVGSAFTPALLVGQSQSQIAADLTYPTSPVTEAIVTGANEITAAICTVTGQRPATVCSTRGVMAADQKMKITPQY